MIDGHARCGSCREGRLDIAGRGEDNHALDLMVAKEGERHVGQAREPGMPRRALPHPQKRMSAQTPGRYRRGRPPRMSVCVGPHARVAARSRLLPEPLALEGVVREVDEAPASAPVELGPAAKRLGNHGVDRVLLRGVALEREERPARLFHAREDLLDRRAQDGVRPDLDEGAEALLDRGLDGLMELHRRPDVAPPVLGVVHCSVHTAAGHRREDHRCWRLRGQKRQRLERCGFHGVHGRAVIRKLHLEKPREHSLGLQARRDRLQRCTVARKHHRVGRVVRRDRNVGSGQHHALRPGSGNSNRQHRAPLQPPHHVAAVVHSVRRLLEREAASCPRRGDLADGVPEVPVRAEPAVTEQLRQGRLDHEVGRLRHPALADPRRVLILDNLRENRPACDRDEIRVDCLGRRPEHRLRFQKLAPHAPPLRAHAVVHEEAFPGRRTSLGKRGVCGTLRMVTKGRDGTRTIRSCDNQPLREVRAPPGKRLSNLAERRLRVPLEKVSEQGAHRAERSLRHGTQRQQLRRLLPALRCPRPGVELGEDRVGVGAAVSERVHRDEGRVGRQGRRVDAHLHVVLPEGDRSVEGGEGPLREYHPGVQDQRRLDEPHDACRGL
mmetsp:Transcript_12504/g.30363  ORF Transcript_12504/g.30363 Transcript_12504/m.30363 type:complete len:610 (-) Transcript_12504:1442-3271(-)